MLIVNEKARISCYKPLERGGAFDLVHVEWESLGTSIISVITQAV